MLPKQHANVDEGHDVFSTSLCKVNKDPTRHDHFQDIVLFTALFVCRPRLVPSLHCSVRDGEDRHRPRRVACIGDEFDSNSRNKWCDNDIEVKLVPKIDVGVLMPVRIIEIISVGRLPGKKCSYCCQTYHCYHLPFQTSQHGPVSKIHKRW